jgi:hypothetical protein
MPARSPFYYPWLVNVINSKYGENTFESFLVRLKLLPLFGITAITEGGSELLHNYINGSSVDIFIHNSFFVSGGFGFLLAHCILYYRRAVGVYPGATFTPKLLK